MFSDRLSSVHPIMMSNCSAPLWLRFFISAGIQKDSAETYAVIFSKNKIQLDMLPEIKKEHLVDMGITLMGHIIAILRHARTVHAEEVTKTTLSTTKGGNTVASEVVVPAAEPISKTTPIVVKEEAVTANTVTKVVSSSHSERPATGSAIVPLAKPMPESTVVEKRQDKSFTDAPSVSSTAVPTRPVTVKRKLASDEATSPEESESKKRIFRRLGQVPNSNSTSDSTSNSVSVFSRLGQKTASPVVVATAKKLPAKPIVSTPKVVPTQEQVVTFNPSTLFTDPKKKVMMMNEGFLTKTIRADQDAPLNVLPSTSIPETVQNSRLGKTNVHSRLGKAAMDSEAVKPAAPASEVKSVSFGSVFVKTIPRVGETLCSCCDQPSTVSVFSRLGF